MHQKLHLVFVLIILMLQLTKLHAMKMARVGAAKNGIAFSAFVSGLTSVFSLASTHDDIMEGSLLFGWMGPLPLA